MSVVSRLACCGVLALASVCSPIRSVAEIPNYSLGPRESRELVYGVEDVPIMKTSDRKDHRQVVLSDSGAGGGTGESGRNPPDNNKSLDKVTVSIDSGLGDLIFQYSIDSAKREDCPNTHIYFLTPKGASVANSQELMVRGKEGASFVDVVSPEETSSYVFAKNLNDLLEIGDSSPGYDAGLALAKRLKSEDEKNPYEKIIEKLPRGGRELTLMLRGSEYALAVAEGNRTENLVKFGDDYKIHKLELWQPKRTMRSLGQKASGRRIKFNFSGDLHSGPSYLVVMQLGFSEDNRGNERGSSARNIVFEIEEGSQLPNTLPEVKTFLEGRWKGRDLDEGFGFRGNNYYTFKNGALEVLADQYGGLHADGPFNLDSVDFGESTFRLNLSGDGRSPRCIVKILSKDNIHFDRDFVPRLVDDLTRVDLSVEQKPDYSLYRSRDSWGAKKTFGDSWNCLASLVQIYKGKEASPCPSGGKYSTKENGYSVECTIHGPVRLLQKKLKAQREELFKKSNIGDIPSPGFVPRKRD
ncbi:hypothetical protein CMI41_01695 [Candidatus Pacearchaeota archaeon]|nr:hypothetical protein [Candidatus Pacearchaeota archaeon]|tara:strand:- start:903 stop:2477 length:1575 start_codon:yes stop_codon:yes gene_type:complete